MARMIRGVEDTNFSRPRPRQRQGEEGHANFSRWVEFTQVNENFSLQERSIKPDTALPMPATSLEDMIVLQDARQRQNMVRKLTQNERFLLGQKAYEDAAATADTPMPEIFRDERQLEFGFTHETRSK